MPPRRSSSRSSRWSCWCGSAAGRRTPSCSAPAAIGSSPSRIRSPRRSTLRSASLFIRWWGLPGVAIATLVPVTVRAVLIVIPVACARVGMSLTAFFATAVWPAVWPALVGAGRTRHRSQSRLDIVVPRAVPRRDRGSVSTRFCLWASRSGRAIARDIIGKLRSLAGWPQLEAA